MLCERLGLNVWEVVGAAATKPYGFMRFTPGPGLGGHCLPDRPLLPLLDGARSRLPDRVHRARRQGQPRTCPTTAPSGSAGRSTGTASRCRQRRAAARRCLQDDVGDIRESPALRLIELLGELGADLSYHARTCRRCDPRASRWTRSRSTTRCWSGPTSSASSPPTRRDYAHVADRAQLLLDFRDVVPEADGKVGAAVTDRAAIGVVGLGGWGKNLLRNFALLPRPTCAAPATPTPPRAPSHAQPPGPCGSRPTPATCWRPRPGGGRAGDAGATHSDLARAALAAGKHVFVEKPMAWNLERGERAARGRCAHRAACSWSATCCASIPAVEKLRELIDSGELGDVLYVYGNRVNLGVIREEENALW